MTKRINKTADDEEEGPHQTATISKGVAGDAGPATGTFRWFHETNTDVEERRRSITRIIGGRKKAF